MQYPKFLYHAKEGAKLIQNEEQEKALGTGWVDSPAKCEEVKEEPKKKRVKK